MEIKEDESDPGGKIKSNNLITESNKGLIVESKVNTGKTITVDNPEQRDDDDWIEEEDLQTFMESMICINPLAELLGSDDIITIDDNLN